MKLIRGGHRIFFIISLSAALLLAPLASIANTIRVGIYQNHPKVFIDAQGNPQGILVDVMNEIAQREGWKVEYVHGTWQDNIERLEKFEIDVLLDVSFSEERAQRFKLNQIFVIDDWVEIFIPVNTRLESIESLKGKRVAVLQGSIQEEFMQQQVKPKFNVNFEILPFPDYATAVMAINSKDVDAIVASRFFFFSEDRGKNIWSSSLILRPSYTFFAFPQAQNDKIIEAFDTHMMDLKNDSESVYYKSIKKWLRPENQKKYGKLVLSLGLIILSLTIAGAIFIVLLRHEIRAKTASLKQSNENFKAVNNNLESLVKQYRQTEQELVKFRFMVENARQEVYLINREGKIIYANNAAQNNLGYSSQELFEGGMKSLDPTYGSRFDDHFNELKNNDIPAFETIHYTKGGRQLNKSIKPFYLKIGEEEFICGFSEDITQQKKSKKALLESQQLFKNLASMSPVGIFRTRTDGYTTYVNPKWCELSGLNFDEAIGDGWLKALHPDDRYKVSRNWNEHTTNGVQSEAEYRFKKPNGSIVWVMGNAVPEMNGEKILGYIGTITDITDRKRAELLLEQRTLEIEKQNSEYRILNDELKKAKAKAEESDKLKSAFLANMSHEIRTPMNAICGFSKLLERNNIEDKKRKEFIDIINSNSQHLLGIINDIVDISKIESGLISIMPNEFDVNNTIESILTSLKPTINREKVSLFVTNKLPTNKSLITGDEVKIRQIVTNLIVNAIKFTRAGQIEVDYLVSNENTLLITVSDTGIGISRENQQKVFERFHQVEGSLEDSRKGTGLGLPISKGFVELMGGKIWVESELGKGSKFFVSIPIINAGSTNKANIKNRTTEADWANKTILLVEDDKHVQFYINEVLSSTNVKTIVVDNGVEAVWQCKENSNIDLVLMDIKLPQMNGIEATKQIRTFNTDIPIIAQTAYAFASDSEKVKLAGCNDIITKPIDANELLNMLKRHLS